MSIKIENLTKKYKDTIALDNLSLEIKEHELFALLGLNGAGKTTTIKMLATLVKPTSGDAFIYGKSINSEEVKELIAISTQETSVARNLTVEENLLFMASIYGLDKNTKNEVMKRIIADFKFKKVLKKKAKTLSGGWQRKLSIAMTLIASPKVLFLDEPTLGLDVIARRELWDIILKLKKEMTIILTTHYMEEATYLSDRIGIISEGKLKALGTAEELIEKAKVNNFEDAFPACKFTGYKGTLKSVDLIDNPDV